MDIRKIKKINVIYLLAYIFIPVVAIFLCGWIGICCFSAGTMAAILTMAPFLLSVLWWIFGGSMIYRRKKKQMVNELDQNGFIRSHTFNSSGCTVIVDQVHGKIALIFSWNPFEHYVLPASHISKIWVDDGRSGSGFLAGSSRVSFLFIVDGIKIRVNTFTSNKRWRMDSNYILTGISKANDMVKALEEARGAAD